MDIETTEDAQKAIIQGRDARDLVSHKSFQQVMFLLEADAKEATELLKEVDAENPKEIRKLQNKIWRYEEMTMKLHTLISVGTQMEEQEEGL